MTKVRKVVKVGYKYYLCFKSLSPVVEKQTKTIIEHNNYGTQKYCYFDYKLFTLYSIIY